VLCSTNRRQRSFHTLHDIAFQNDHLDAFSNADVDAAIILSSFVLVAEADGLGVCPISAIRTHAAVVSRLLKILDRVFPVAGLALGYPAIVPNKAAAAPISKPPVSTQIHFCTAASPSMTACS
jgi:nitroreductase/FMN reductase [NAD(P)H]